MSRRRLLRRGPAVALLAVGLLVALLAGCGKGPGRLDAFGSTRAAVSPTVAGRGVPGAPEASGAAEGSGPGRGVSCAGRVCSLRLSPGSPAVTAFGTTITLRGVAAGRATLAVGDAVVSCADGEAVRVGGLPLRCTELAGDGVTVTAEVG